MSIAKIVLDTAIIVAIITLLGTLLTEYVRHRLEVRRNGGDKG